MWMIAVGVGDGASTMSKRKGNSMSVHPVPLSANDARTKIINSIVGPGQLTLVEDQEIGRPHTVVDL